MITVNRPTAKSTKVEINGEWATVWLYKHPFVKLLIEEMQANESDGRPSPLAVWSTGKLFGYSDYEIARYLQEQGYIGSAFA